MQVPPSQDLFPEQGAPEVPQLQLPLRQRSARVGLHDAQLAPFAPHDAG